ncbi:conjugal transfer protein TraG N-terminal domain-containing protein [Pseudoduganella umbonata]|uniref:Conjugal transfer mating pair stabilization protein TraG n=1 Tax=Pseudoduganella umbonata TaxID=864828 RepID=A0A4V1ECX1_9BURK|nr:conjugal transfer protein TraG N-terminal domain-containing protein [Pseudoduganella umbonata]MBB3221719.1 conjugal transfer mating pair stabilization protein TraG [Pseudoduganella umbonata]QCP09061.1 conjugal transfer protein TraG [Pseudoduganella umbonata]
MGDTITVLAYFNAAERADLYNAIAALTASGTFKDMLRTVTMVAFIAMLFGLAFRRDQDPMEFIRWIIVVTAFQSLLVVPKVTVSVVDRTGGAAPVVIDNVPLVLAYLNSLTSRAGDALTRGAETVMALPDDLLFQKRGLMFGGAVFVDTLQAAPVSATFRDDLTRFVNNCTYYDILSGRISPDTLTTSADIWNTMATTSNALNTPITGSEAGSMPCKDAYANLNGRWKDEIASLARARGRILNPAAIDNTVAATLLTSQIASSYAALAGMSVDAVAALRQNMALNAVRDSQMIAAQRLDSSSAAIVGATQAQTEMTANLQYMAMARVAERATPRMRNVIEIICDFVFPMVVCLLILAIDQMGKILKTYAMTLAWVQLIPPLYAVLNFIMVRSGKPTLVGIASSADGTPAVNLQNIAQLSQQGLSDMAIAGYMSLFIPVIAWGLVKTGEVGGAALFSAMNGPAFGAGGSAASGMATGNLSQGNVSLDTTSANTVNAHHYDVAPSVASGYIRSSTAAGTAISGPDGTFRYQANQSSLGFTANFGQKIGNALTQEASNRQEKAKRESTTASDLRSTALTERMGITKAYTDEHGTNNTDEIAKSSRATKTLSQLQQIAETVNDKLGLASSSDIGRKIVGTLATGASIDFSKILGAKLGIDTSRLDEAGKRKALEAVTDFAKAQLQSRGITIDDALSDDFRRSDVFHWGAQHRSESVNGSEASLAKSRQHEAAAEQAKSEAETLSRQASVVTDHWVHSSMNYEGYIASRLQQDGRLGLFSSLYQTHPEKAAEVAAGYLAETNFDVLPTLPPVTTDIKQLSTFAGIAAATGMHQARTTPASAESIDQLHEQYKGEIRQRGYKEVNVITNPLTAPVSDALESVQKRMEQNQQQLGGEIHAGKARVKPLLDRKNLVPKGEAPEQAEPGSVAEHQDRLHKEFFKPGQKKSKDE